MKVSHIRLSAAVRRTLAETASGPPPVYADFLADVQAFGRLAARRAAVVFIEEGDVPDARMTAYAIVDAAKAGLEYRRDEKTGRKRVVKKRSWTTLRFASDARAKPDFHTFHRAFRLDLGRVLFELTSGKLDPFVSASLGTGLRALDL